MSASAPASTSSHAGTGRRAVRPVSIASFAQAKNRRRDAEHNEVEMLMPVIADVFGNIGITKDDVGFICSGSTDYLVGGPFSFVTALDAVGVWPPRAESHVEMDGAWALYEAWVLLQEGEIDAALVYLRSLLAGELERDPEPAARPLLPRAALAGSGEPRRACRPRALIDAGKATEADFAAIASRSRKDALSNPNAQVAKDVSAEELLAEEYVVSPLRQHTLPPITDGAAAIVLAAGDKAASGRSARSGSPASTIAWRPTPSVHGISAPRRRSLGPPRRPESARVRSTSPSYTPPSPIRRSSSKTPSGSEARQARVRTVE